MMPPLGEMMHSAKLLGISLWLVAGPALGQTPPSPTDDEQASLTREALQQAVAADRRAQEQEVADFLMERVAEEEMSELKRTRWTSGIFALGALGWGAAAALNEAEGGRVGGTIALGAASALSLGLATSMLALDDPYAARKVARWGLLAEGAMGATALLFLARTCSHSDCHTATTMTAVGTLAVTLGAAAGELIWPEPWVSRSIDHYRTLPASERAPFARDVLWRRDRVRRERAHFDYALSVALAGALASTIPALERPAARSVTGILAGTTLLTATIHWLIRILEPAPSERLLSRYARTE